MQHVLVHIDQGLGPIGAWSYSKEGHLTHFYPESLDVSISGRARLLMAHRTLDVQVPEWMDFIADSDPTLLDTYQTFDVNDGHSLTAVLAEFRRSWATPDKP
jgi:hypothetical protein